LQSLFDWHFSSKLFYKINDKCYWKQYKLTQSCLNCV
jgi:hypothetical protein